MHTHTHTYLHIVVLLQAKSKLQLRLTHHPWLIQRSTAMPELSWHSSAATAAAAVVLCHLQPGVEWWRVQTLPGMTSRLEHAMRELSHLTGTALVRMYCGLDHLSLELGPHSSMLARDHSPPADLGSSGRPPAVLRPLHLQLGESALPLVHVFSLLAHHLLPLECRRDSKTVHFQLGPGRRQSAHTLSGLPARCGGFVPPSLLGHQQVVIHHSVGGTLHAGDIGIGRCYLPSGLDYRSLKDFCRRRTSHLLRPSCE